MARRKKGRNVSGWIVIDKPAGPTSTAVVNKLRWAFDARKAGHAGTLDPAATGLLAVAFGEATKTIPFVTDADKCYRFRVQLGEVTNTDDAEGEVIATSETRPSDDEIENALASLTGNIMQQPPKFSAIKVDGERAYKLAREGNAPELEARPLFVERLKITGRPSADLIDCEMVCGKGGYVRSIARDLGELLGCGGHVVSLRRIWSGPFDLDMATDLATIEENAKDSNLDAYLRPLEIALEGLPEAMCPDDAVVRLRNGNPGRVLRTDAEYGDTAWASHRGRAIAVGTYRAGELHPNRVFLT